MSTDISNEPLGSTGKNINMDNEKQALQSKDADVALEFLNHETATSMTEIDEKKLVRKIDYRIVPLMCSSLPNPGVFLWT